MRKELVVFPVIFALSLLPASCKKLEQKKEIKASAPEQKKVVFAKVNEAEVTAEDFERQLKQLPSHLAAKTMSTEEGKKKFLEDLISRELLIQEARQKGLNNDPSILQRINDLKERMVLELFLTKEIEEKITVSDDEVRDFYNTHEEEIRNEVEASHILVDTRDKAREALNRLKAGENFGKLADELSVDTGSNKKGGRLGIIRWGETVAEFQSVAFSLKSGEISDIISTPYGFHIIKVTNKRINKDITLDNINDRLRDQLLREKQEKAFNTLVTKLRSKARITINEIAYSSHHSDLPNSSR